MSTSIPAPIVGQVFLFNRHTKPKIETTKMSALSMCQTAFRCLLWVFAIIVAANLMLIPLASGLEDIKGHWSFVIGQINLDDEENFTTWASSMLLVIAAVGSFALSSKRSSSHPFVAKLLLFMGLGFVVLSMDDVAQIHGYIEDVVAGVDPDADDDAPDTPADELESKLGPVFSGSLAVLFGLIFLMPLARSARTPNIRYLVGCVVCVAMVALSEIIYKASGCDNDWCYQIEVFFEESFEFGAIILFLAFVMREIFFSEIEVVPVFETGA